MICFLGSQNLTIYKRAINATLHGSDMIPLLYLHNIPDSNVSELFHTSHPEQECMVKCMMMENCHAIQTVYYNDEFDEMVLMKNVKWCVLLEVGESGGFTSPRDLITSNVYSKNTSFGFTENIVPSIGHLGLLNDYQNNWIGVLVKGKYNIYKHEI